MATPLTYRPVVATTKTSTSLRKALLDRLWPKEDYATPVLVDETWIGYFQGLKDAGVGYVGEVDTLIEVLKTNGRLQFELS